MDVVGFGLFFIVWLTMFLASIGGLICAVAALISISRMDAEAFGPWWDNTKSAWLIGIAVSFALPMGSLVTGVYWFWKGRAPVRTTGQALRPFWVGPPKPMPMWPPAGAYPPYAQGPWFPPPSPDGQAPPPYPPAPHPPGAPASYPQATNAGAPASYPQATYPGAPTPYPASPPSPGLDEPAP